MPKANKKKKFKAPIVHVGEAIQGSPPVPKARAQPPAKRWAFTRITTLKATLLIALLGLTVYFSGLHNQFLADDEVQVVNNPVVHSISNIGLFFKGGTFYEGHGTAPLGGVYFRPLMTTTYAWLYSTYGSSPLAFHLFQLLLQIASTILLFLVFRYFFKPGVSLALSLIFLVHPINSQAVYYIAAMQEPLFFFFGILALWTFLRFQDKSYWYMVITALCLFLSLLSKESGILFIAIVLIYAFIVDRRRSYALSGLLFLPVVFYLSLKIHAVGLAANPHNAPIDSLNLWHRLLNAPAIVQFYLTKVIFPWQLANGYYWAYKTISLRHVILPLIIDLAILGLILCVARFIRKRGSQRNLVLFTFFSLWFGIGLLLNLQIIPLDLTASETWFYFPLAGLLGMIGVTIESAAARLPRRWSLFVIIGIIAVLGVRTSTRSQDWSSLNALAYHDVNVSKEDYNSQSVIAFDLMKKGELAKAKKYAEQSISIFPNYNNNATLGLILFTEGDYSGAYKAYNAAIKFQANPVVYEQMAQLTLFYGGYDSNDQFVGKALRAFPQDGSLLSSYALLEYKNHNLQEAQGAITQAARFGGTNQYAYDAIMNQQPVNFSFYGHSQSISP